MEELFADMRAKENEAKRKIDQQKQNPDLVEFDLDDNKWFVYDTLNDEKL